jgi:hypothetical protein
MLLVEPRHIYDPALIGIDYADPSAPRAVYRILTMIEALAENWAEADPSAPRADLIHDAREYVEYNILADDRGPLTPIYVDDTSDPREMIELIIENTEPEPEPEPERLERGH